MLLVLILVVIGLCQSAAPYILVIYSLQYLPPTLLGVFLVITPWWTAVIQRIPAFKVNFVFSQHLPYQS